MAIPTRHMLARAELPDEVGQARVMEAGVVEVPLFDKLKFGYSDLSECFPSWVFRCI